MTANKSFEDFVNTIKKLRDPESGCPWDLKQDHKSLRSYMLEEAYEAVEAMGSGDFKHLVEELGDVLLQVVLNAQILSESSNYSVEDVVDSINKKMIRRHPHVFDESFTGSKDVSSIKENWNKIKAEEKKEIKDKGVFEKIGKSPLSSFCRKLLK